MEKKLILTLSMIYLFNALPAQQVLCLYVDSIANGKITFQKEERPTLSVFLPKQKFTNAAVLVIPGGAYGFLALNEEGLAIGRSFAERGVAAFVLKYRLPGTDTTGNKSFIPLTDAQQSIKYIRDHAKEYGIDTNRVGVIGFSAGGHLAATLETHFDTCLVDNTNHTNLRPDFAILVYPVISMESNVTHPGSRINLMGENPAQQKVKYFSAEQQVTQHTPPTYITHTADDQIVGVQNSMMMYASLVNNGVAAELHLFPKGDHGFIQRLPVNEWLDPIMLFLRKQGFYKN